MNTRNQSKIASVLSLLVGVWVVASPIWINFTGGALTSVIITGSIIVIASVAQLFTVNAAPSWIIGAASLWLLLSAIFFNVGTAAGWSQIVSAVIGMACAYWDGQEVTSLANTTTRGTHHKPGATAI